MPRRIQADVQRRATDRVDLGLRHVELARGRRPETRAQRTTERQPVRHLVARRRLPHRLSTERLVILEPRSEEHTSELQSLMRISYAVFCLKKKTKHNNTHTPTHNSHQLYANNHQ